MKKLFVILAFVLTYCLLFSACGEVKAPAPAPAIATTMTPEPTAAATAKPTGGEDDFDYRKIDEVKAYLQEYYSDLIEQANEYRVNDGDAEYYFDTGKIIEMDNSIEFPLYRHKQDKMPEYLGTTGFAFQKFGDYIYIQSDPFQEDCPDGTLTRVVDLNNLSVTPIGRNIYIFTPKEGNKVYYTKDFAGTIYIADAALTHVKELPIEIPDKAAVDKKVGELCGFDPNELIADVGITNVEKDWICFTYWMFEFEGPSYYEGNYRIKTDGSKIEKIGEGKFGDEEDSED